VDRHILLLFAWIFLSWAALAIEEFYFHRWLKRIGVPVRFIFTSIPGSLVRTYLAWCEANGVPPNPRWIRTDRWLRRNALASLGGFIVLFGLVVVQQRRLHP